MTELIAGLVAAIVAVCGLLWGVVKQMKRADAEEAKVREGLLELEEVRRKAEEHAREERAIHSRQRERDQRTLDSIRDIDGRTYQSLRREPVTPGAMEDEANGLFAEAEREELSDAFGAGEGNVSSKGPKP